MTRFTHVKRGWQTGAVPAEQTKERLLDAAWSEATSQGIDELTLGKVAAKAGVSRQAVYLHFGNRATLLVELARRIDHTSGFRKRLAKARDNPPLLAFRRSLEEWFSYLPIILPLHRVLEAGSLTGGDGAAAYRDRMQDWRDDLRITVAPLAEVGLLPRRWDVESATDWVWASVHPTTFHHLVTERGWTPARVATTTIETLERELVEQKPRRASPKP